MEWEEAVCRREEPGMLVSFSYFDRIEHGVGEHKRGKWCRWISIAPFGWWGWVTYGKKKRRGT
jgi:hypothetical protein